MFRNSREIRRWAARLLLLWLLGVASGVANACWIDEVTHFGGERSAEAVSTDTRHDANVSHDAEENARAHALQGTTGSLHHGSIDDSICQASCEKVSGPISTLKSPLDHTPSLAMPALGFAAAKSVPGKSSIHVLMPRRDGGLAPPVAIAFLRLAL